MSIHLIDNLKINAPKAMEERSGKFVSGVWTPFASVAEANSANDPSVRHRGLTVYISVSGVLTEFWYKDGVGDSNLVLKAAGGSGTVDQSIIQNSTNAVAGGAVSTALSGKVDKDGTKVLSDINFTVAKDTKLNGIQAGATVNDTNENLRNRVFHTGSQPASSISDFTTAARAAFTAGTNITISNGVISATTSSTATPVVVKQTHLSGASVTIANNTSWLIINPSALIANLAISFPVTPFDGQLIEISFGGTISTGVVCNGMTLNAGTGKSFVDPYAPTAVDAGETMVYRYNSSNSKWYRIY